jgi:hypothetical protein
MLRLKYAHRIMPGSCSVLDEEWEVAPPDWLPARDCALPDPDGDQVAEHFCSGGLADEHLTEYHSKEMYGLPRCDPGTWQSARHKRAVERAWFAERRFYKPIWAQKPKPKPKKPKKPKPAPEPFYEPPLPAPKYVRWPQQYTYMPTPRRDWPPPVELPEPSPPIDPTRPYAVHTICGMYIVYPPGWQR